MSEFRVVSFKKFKNRRTKSKVPINFHPSNNSLDELDPIDKDKVIKKIEDTKLDVINSEYYKNFLEQLNNCLEKNHLNRLICFGLGNFATCHSSRIQFAFIQLIIEEFGIADILFSDPIFRNGEKEILHKFGYQIVEKNLEGKLKITFNENQDERVLLYLPHCPTQLTNNILYANWGSNLNRFIVIGNSISSIISNSVKSYLVKNAEFVLKIQPAVREFTIEDNYKITNVFNDTSIHRFDRETITNWPIDFWCTDIEEPVYDPNDLEIILSSSEPQNQNIEDGNQIRTTDKNSTIVTG